MPARHARYGPLDRYETPPAAGMCISVFAVVQRGRKVLVGTPAQHPRWPEDWIPQFAIYPKAEQEAVWRTRRLPSCYLREGEDPAAALERILREQLGAKRYEVGKLEVSSWLAPSDWYPGHQHWDLALTYRVKASLPAKPGAWWAQLGYEEPRTLKSADFGWNHDFVEAIGVAKR
jgi:ADP-ribose pyrophosphatase YjhB (NUDIX family)